MRMRLKKNLDSRLEKCQRLLVAQEGYDFYQLPEEQRFKVQTVEQLFGNNHPLYLEIGCGKGSYAIKCAKAHPERNYIAVEKLSNVIVAGCEMALEENLTNLKFLNCSAENLLYYLPQHSATQIILNFSCPYPKKTYANRRLTYKTFLQLYTKLLTSDGIVCQKTDDKNFFDFSLESFAENGWTTYDVTYDLHSTTQENVTTEYEEKFVAQGKQICALKAQQPKR